LNINKGNITEANYTFSLIDVNGKTVLNSRFENASLLERVNVSELSSGIYVGILETATNKITKKIIIE
jgi:aminopeptidase YwaD